MKRIGQAVGIVIAVLGVLFVARELVRSRAEVISAARETELWMLLAALIVAIASMATIGLAWRRCLAVLGVNRSRLEALRSYFVGQLGKYVPGGIWPVIGRAEMARRDGVSGSAAYGSTVLSLVLTYLAAILTFLGAFMAGAAAGGRGTWWLLLLVLLPLGILSLHPFVIERVLVVLRRFSRRRLDLEPPGWSTSIVLLIRHVPAWFGIAGATWLVASALDDGVPDLRNLVFATTLSWVVGFLAIGVPGGIGVREAVFIGAATTLSSTGVAAAVALIARVVFILADLTGAAVASLLASRSRQRQKVHLR